MSIVVNRTKKKLEEGKVAFGVTVRYSRSIEIARAAATSSYDYLFIDLEHSTIDLDMASQISIAALDAGVTPLVRVPSHLPHHSARILDGGAQGVVVPHVHTAEQARQAVENCKFPPIGRRSHAGAPLQVGWKSMPVPELAKVLNDNMLLTCLIESVEAVEGVDVLSVGTNDLAFDMGLAGDYEHPRVIDCYSRVVAAARRNGKAVRLGGVYDPALVQKNIEGGARLVTVMSDWNFMLQGMRSGIQSLRGRLDPAII